jgi:GNAT superfamily N-acetyltransferase
VLRPDQPAANSAYPGDDDPSSAHAAVFAPASTARTSGDGVDGEPVVAPVVVAVGTVLFEPPPWDAGRRHAWRVRGMATMPDWRGLGLGSAVLAALVDHAGAHGGELAWCNARVPARRLYERAGFVGRGEVFDIPGIGPHIRMWRALAVAPA